MSSFIKTFKNEYHLGGQCRIQKIHNMILIDFGRSHPVGKVFNYKTLSTWKTEAKMFLEMNTSSYWAEKIFEFLISKMNENS